MTTADEVLQVGVTPQKGGELEEHARSGAALRTEVGGAPHPTHPQTLKT